MGHIPGRSAIPRVRTSEPIPVTGRIAGLLILLYAQPATRIARLTTSAVINDGNTTKIRLGDPPTPVPAPLAR